MRFTSKIKAKNTKPGFTIKRSDGIQAIFKKPASSNLFSAAADLQRRKKVSNP